MGRLLTGALGLTLGYLQHGEAHVVAELHRGEPQQQVGDLRPQQVAPGATHGEVDVHRLLLAPGPGLGDVHDLERSCSGTVKQGTKLK